MTTLYSDGKYGRKVIQLNSREGNGERPRIKLGRMKASDAKSAKAKVDAIIAAKRSRRSVDAETADWIATLEPSLADQLAAIGLISPRETLADQPRQTVIGFVDDYTAKRTDVKPATQLNYGKTRKYLKERFGTEKRLDAVTQLDAEEFRVWLLSKGLKENTARSLCKCAKLFFGAAVKGELIRKNPFAGIKTQLVVRTDRMQFVTLEETVRLLDAAPNADWRCIIALARYGGLRTPSETLAVRWDDVDWGNNRLMVRSSKTEHHAGKETRWIPLFPELHRVLLEASELAPTGAEFVVHQYRDKAKNLQKPFEKIIQRAGLTPWKKLFQNLRSSRETELARLHPLHVVVSWMGNSQVVALGHYLQVQDGDFQRAAAEPTPETVQKTVQHHHASRREPSHRLPQKTNDPTENSGERVGAKRRKSLQSKLVPPVGLEPTTNRLRVCCSAN
jgi:integrase